MKNKVTIKDIANEANVSIATVSRVLSQKGTYKSDTAVKVISIAYKLGYPGVTYLEQSDKQIRNIALITPAFEGEFYSSLYFGFYEASLSTEFNVSLNFINYGLPNLVDQVLTLAHKYDALCLFLPSLTEDDYMEIRNRVPLMPIISIAPISNPVLETVTFDSYSGGDLVAKHFHESGWSQVGIINGSRNLVEALLRRNGYIDRIKNTDGMSCLWEYEGNYTFESGVRAYRDFKKRGLPNMAVFAANDEMAFGFINEAKKDNISFSKDMAIAGFDDVNMANLMTPRLTSVSVDYIRMGKVALRQLKNKITQGIEEDGHLIMIPVNLRVRESSSENR